MAVLTYIGFDGISTLSEEVHNPRRNILLATVLVCVVTGVLASVQVYLAQLVWPDGHATDAFLEPPGEPALVAADSITWQVFKNPLALFIGGVTAVVLELGEPRVRSGVWQYTSFRERHERDVDVLDACSGLAAAPGETATGAGAR